MPESRCPACGYCPHCGRSDALPYVVRPVWIPPYHPHDPYWPHVSPMTAGGTTTVAPFTVGTFPGSSSSFTA